MTILKTALIASIASLLLITTASAADYKAPRMPDGSPNFQGVWTNASLTRMSRSEEFTDLVIPTEKIEDLNYNAYYNRRLRNDNQVTDPNAPPPEKGGDVKGYNNFWIDPGDSYGQIAGEYRSSWITEPENGQVPWSREGRQLRLAAFRRGGDEESGRAGMYDGPEIRTLGDRCLISFGSSAGPPMNNVMYNNHYQFVQTPDHVMIMVEMNHDARIIDMNGEHNPSAVKEWFGSSVGRWEGETLVVETRNVNPLQEARGAFPISEQGKVIERFTRISEDQLLYEFHVEDPKYYTQGWKGEMAFNKDDERIYEYACHEGNYALPGILAGARRQEQEAAEAAAK